MLHTLNKHLISTIRLYRTHNGNYRCLHNTKTNSTIFKQYISDLRNVQSVINGISNVEVWANGATGLLNANSLNSLKTAVSGLSKEQALLVLSTKNLTQAQKEQVLIEAGIIASNDKINASIVQRALTESTLTAEQQKDILTKLELINVETGEVITTNACTKAALEEVLAKKGIVGADAEAIISSIGLTSANGTQTISFDLLTASIWANIEALGKWLITNPIGWVILGTTAIFGLVKAYDALTDSTEEVKERTDALLDSYNSAISEANSNAKTIESLASRYETLSKGVNNLGENVSLTADEYSEYNDIVNQIAEMFPTMITGYTDEGNAILSLKGNVEQLRDAYKEAQQEAYNLLIVSGEDGDGNDIITNYQNQIYGNESFLSKTSSYIDGEAGAKNAIDVITKLTGALTPDEFRETYNQLYEEYENVWNSDKIQDALNSSGFKELAYYDEITAEDLAKVKYSAQATIQTYKSEIDSQLQNVRTLANAYLMTNSDYEKLDEQSKTATSLLVNSIDESIADGFENKSDVGAYVAKLISSVSNNEDVKKALTELFKMDTTDMSVNDIQNNVDSYISTIATAIGENPIELKARLGFDDSDTEPLVNKVQGLLSDEFDNRVGELTLEELDITSKLEIPEGTLLTWDELIAKIKEVQGSTLDNETAISSQKTFDEVWNSIGEGDDDAGKKAQEAKEKVLELAEAGKLTEKAFEKSSIADTFTQAGHSIEKATKKINDMVSSADQLASMKSGISSISSILGEKKENLSNKKTKNEGIGADTLSGMPDDVKSQTKEYENFVKVLGNGASTMQQCREAANNLATAYVNSYNFLSKLTPETVGYYTSVLKQMGVENASEVVTNALAKQTYALRLEKLANSNATKEEITALQEEASQYGITSTALANYVIQKRIANNNALDTSKSISNLIKLAKQCGATSNVVIALQNLLKSTSELESLYQKDLTDFSSNAATDLQHAPDAVANEKSEQIGKASAKISASRKKLLKLIKDSTKIGASVKIKPTSPSNGSKGSKGSKDSSKNTKTEINWLERRLTRMQSIIDLTASKLQNLFSVKAKNNNLDKQIKQTTKLMNQYKIAADTYMKKANSVAKSSGKGKNKVSGLSKDIIKKVQSGEITKASYSKLIKKYGQKKADKINSYIDYYDKAQDAKKNAEDQKAKKRELQVQKQTNIQEEADKKSALYQAERELAQLKDKNGWIKKEIDSTIESYDAQIKAAEIQKDTVEKDKLIAEQKKALLALYQEEIDNIKANSEVRIQSLENGVVNNNGTRKSYGQKYYQNQVALAESRGNKVNKDWYRQQSAIENQKISEYTAERNQLIKELAKFTEGTTEWYNLQADIQACDDSINEARIAQAENTKAMRELTEKMEQEYDDWFSNLNNEISFISSLASGDMTDSDKGTFTDAGNLAMYSQSLLFQSSNAEKEYWKTQTNKLQKLIDTNASVAQIQAAGFEFNSIEDANDALTSYRQNWQDAIKEEKQAEEEIINLMKERYEAEKDYLQDIVDAKKEALSVEKDLYDYERNIAEKTKNVVTLQKRINSLRGDTSEEGRARLSKLQVELDNAQKDLQDTEYDRYISEQQNMLDNMMSQYEDLITKLQKNTDKILEDGLNDVNTNLGSLTTLFQERAKAYDYQMSTDLSTINQKLNDGSLEIISKNSDIAQLLAGESGASENNVISLLRGMGDSIIKSYDDYKAKQNTPPPTPTNNNGGSGSGSGNGSRGSGSTKQQTQTANGQTTVTPDAMDKIEGTNAKLKKLRDALNSMKGAGFEKYWTKKNGTPKSYINQRIAAEPNYDKIVNGKHLHPQILTEAGLKLLAKKLGVKYPASSGAKTTNLNNYVKEAGFKTGGIAQLIKSNGEDGLMLARNGEGFVAPEHVQDIKELMKVIPDMNKFISSVTETPNIPIARNNQPSNSIGEVLFNIDVNPKDFPDFVSQLQNEKRVQQVFSVAVNDLTQKGKITNNIQRY